TVTAFSTDTAGNVSSNAVVTFTYDTTLPTAAITFPANNGKYNAASWTGSITGTAGDTAPGTVANVKLTIQRSSDNQFWNGSAWQVASVQLTASGTTSWSQALAASNLTTNVTYTVTAFSTDTAGNVSTNAVAIFTYDTTNPIVAITFP